MAGDLAEKALLTQIEAANSQIFLRLQFKRQLLRTEITVLLGALVAPAAASGFNFFTNEILLAIGVALILIGSVFVWEANINNVEILICAFYNNFILNDYVKKFSNEEIELFHDTFTRLISDNKGVRIAPFNFDVEYIVAIFISMIGIIIYLYMVIYKFFEIEGTLMGFYTIIALLFISYFVFCCIQHWRTAQLTNLIEKLDPEKMARMENRFPRISKAIKAEG